MRKDLVLIAGIGIPVTVFMVLIGGDGHSPIDFQDEGIVTPISQDTIQTDNSSQECSGDARCITGTVTKIIDGDTIHVDDQSIRFALSSAPELKGYGGVESRTFIQTICPIGSIAVVDEDDSQREESYGRIIGVIYCNGLNLNQELLDSNLGYLEARFCNSSEFADDSWAVKHGC